MESQTQRVVVETAYYRIVGDLTLPREGYRSRISDFLNQTERPFVALTDATIFGGDPTDSTVSVRREFVAIGVAHIQFVYPDDGGDEALESPTD